MYACKLGNKEIAQLLIKEKADVNATNKVKDTCMAMA